MQKNKVFVNYSDSEYCSAVKRALALCNLNLELVEHADDAFTVDELSFPLYQSISFIKNEIANHFNLCLRSQKKICDTLFTAFCSGVGGSGLSTAAMCYAKLLSRVYSKKVGFLSFDPGYRNNFDDFDLSGVDILESVPEESDFDELVIDLPYSSDKYGDYLDMCERRIVVMGFDEKRYSASESLFRILKESSQHYYDVPLTVKFINHFDQDINNFDIHSQLGKELLDLINSIETYMGDDYDI